MTSTSIVRALSIAAVLAIPSFAFAEKPPAAPHSSVSAPMKAKPIARPSAPAAKAAPARAAKPSPASAPAHAKTASHTKVKGH